MLFYVMAPSQDKSNLSYAWVIYSFVCFVEPFKSFADRRLKGRYYTVIACWKHVSNGFEPFTVGIWKHNYRSFAPHALDFRSGNAGGHGKQNSSISHLTCADCSQAAQLGLNIFRIQRETTLVFQKIYRCCTKKQICINLV